MWEQYANLFIKSIFIENMVFAYFLGMCSYLAISKTLKNGVGMGLAVIFVLTITVPLNYLIYEYLLVDGALAWIGPEYAELDLSFLSLIMFIAVIASMVQLVEMIVEKFSPALYGSLGIRTSLPNVKPLATLLHRIKYKPLQHAAIQSAKPACPRLP
jgi:Na+-transporting NADH:ubiquinone oxidoreductase subunit E